MKKLFFVIGLLVILASCSEKKSTAQTAALAPGIHKVIALESINTSKYTYVKVNDGGVEKWIAGPLADIKAGSEYYYGNEMPMANFASKELNRTFDMVYFVEGITAEPPVMQPATQTGGGQNPQPMAQNGADASASHAGSAGVKTEKLAVEVKPAKGGITIADLIANKEKYAGKKVVVKGKVSKFNGDVMDRNWIHIQDGTEFNGNFDLTLTTKQSLAVGDVASFEGTVVLNKDFGAGYVYAILLEDVVIKK